MDTKKNFPFLSKEDSDRHLYFLEYFFLATYTPFVLSMHDYDNVYLSGLSRPSAGCGSAPSAPESGHQGEINPFPVIPYNFDSFPQC